MAMKTVLQIHQVGRELKELGTERRQLTRKIRRLPGDEDPATLTLTTGQAQVIDLLLQLWALVRRIF